MKRLFVMRGIPGSGKTRWIKEHNLEDYTVSSDNIRLLLSAPILAPDGNLKISNENNKRVWEIVMDTTEERMKRGEVLFIDATNVVRNNMSKFISLGKKYGYDINCIDFSDISFETAEKQNRNREDLRVVPDYIMKRMYDALQKDIKLPDSVKRILPENFNECLIEPEDLSSYDKIHVIGDIHGCYSVLKDYLGEKLNDNEYYIFLGDYLDRGIENVKTLNFLMSLSDKKNVCLLEGNHEAHLRAYADNEKSHSKTFEEITKKELERAGTKRKKVRVFCKKLKPCKYYSYRGNDFLACHGGISNIPGNLLFVSDYQLIHGTGDYGDYKETEKSFDKNTPDNLYQIHGHRNTENSPIHSTKKCYNLEGEVEHGKYLRAVDIDKNGIHEIETKNEIYKGMPDKNTEIIGNIWDLADGKAPVYFFNSNPVDKEIEKARREIGRENKDCPDNDFYAER